MADERTGMPTSTRRDFLRQLGALTAGAMLPGLNGCKTVEVPPIVWPKGTHVANGVLEIEKITDADNIRIYNPGLFEGQPYTKIHVKELSGTWPHLNVYYEPDRAGYQKTPIDIVVDELKLEPVAGTISQATIQVHSSATLYNATAGLGNRPESPLPVGGTVTVHKLTLGQGGPIRLHVENPRGSFIMEGPNGEALDARGKGFTLISGVKNSRINLIGSAPDPKVPQSGLRLGHSDSFTWDSHKFSSPVAEVSVDGISYQANLNNTPGAKVIIAGVSDAIAEEDAGPPGSDINHTLTVGGLGEGGTLRLEDIYGTCSMNGVTKGTQVITTSNDYMLAHRGNIDQQVDFDNAKEFHFDPVVSADITPAERLQIMGANRMTLQVNGTIADKAEIFAPSSRLEGLGTTALNGSNCTVKSAKLLRREKDANICATGPVEIAQDERPRNTDRCL